MKGKDELEGTVRGLLQPPLGELWLSDQEGVPRDPRFVFHAFYYFRLRFFHRYFFLIVTIGYASSDAKKLNRPRHFLAN